VRTIGKQVIFGRGTNRRCQAGAEFLGKKCDHLAHALQGESAAAKLADNGCGYELIPVVNAPVSVTHGSDQSALIPPLQLAGRDAGEADHIVG